MKKFTKVILILAAVFFVIGICCVIGSIALGATWGTLDRMVKDGKFNFGVTKDELDIADSQREEITEECRELEIEFGAGSLEISYRDVDHIEVSQLDVSGYECYVKDGTLHIEGGNRIGLNSGDGILMITIPKDYQFEEVDLQIGAGKATVEMLNTKEFDAEVGAGELVMTIPGVEADYNYELECGVGEIQVGGEKYGGLGNEKEVVNPGATKHFSVECGAGKVEIQFLEEI